MYCKNCGAFIEEGNLFCSKCGTKVKRNDIEVETNDYQEDEDNKDKRNLEEVSGEVLDNVKGGFNSIGQKIKKWFSKVKARPNTVKLVAIISAIVIVVVIGGVVLFRAFFGPTPERIVDKYINYMIDGDYTKAFEYTDIDNVYESDSDYIDMDSVAEHEENTAKQYEETNLLKLTETFNNGKSAKVEAKLEWVVNGNVKKITQKFTLKKQDGTWKICVANNLTRLSN